MEVRIYRWEDSYGYGPYNAYHLNITDDDVDKFYLPNKYSLFDHNDDLYHPSLEIENKCVIIKNKSRFTEKFGSVIMPKCNVKFGFSSIMQMHDWFNEHEIDILKHFNFKLKVYYVDDKDVRYLTKQVMFITDNVIKIEDFNL